MYIDNLYTYARMASMTATGRTITAPVPGGCPVRRGNRMNSVVAVRPSAQRRLHLVTELAKLIASAPGAG
jgi:hypothetical protein